MTTEEKYRFLEGIDCPSCKGRERCALKIECQDCEDAEEYLSGCFRCTLKKFKRPFRAQVAGVLSAVLGDDTDGIAAAMEDAEWMFGADFWE